MIKGSVHRIYMAGPRNRIQFRNTVCFKLFFIPVAATVDFLDSRIGTNTLSQLLVDHFGPICDTIKST